MQANDSTQPSCRYCLPIFLLSGILLGILVFFGFFGSTILNPAATGWLEMGDQLQTYAAWGFYNQHPATFSSGIPGYPPGGFSTLGQLDGIPLWSVFIRSLGVLRGVEQPLGWWLLLCYALQGLFSAAIAFRWCHRWPARMATLVLLSAPSWLLTRAGHLTLCAQWLLLASLLVFGGETEANQKGWVSPRRLAALFLPVMVAAGLHPYLTAMTLLIASVWLVGFAVGYCDAGDLRPISRVMIAGGLWTVLLSLAVLIMHWAGFFAGGVDLNPSNALGYYTADVLGFFNSYGKAVLVPSFAASRMGQYEGYSYLGAGGILLLAFAFIGRNIRKPLSTNAWRLLVGAAGIAWLLALGEMIRVAGHWVVALHWFYKPLYPILAPFRSIGRFVWIPGCVILIAAARRIESRFRPPVCLAVFVGAILLQAIDFSSIQPIPKSSSQIQSPDSNAFWSRAAARRISRILLVPPSWPRDPCAGDDHSVQRFARYSSMALRFGISINSAFLGRSDAGVAQADCDRVLTMLRVIPLDPTAVYIVSTGFLDDFLASADGKWRCTIDAGGQNLCEPRGQN